MLTKKKNHADTQGMVLLLLRKYVKIFIRYGNILDTIR